MFQSCWAAVVNEDVNATVIYTVVQNGIIK